jgi:hypothetical protein
VGFAALSRNTTGTSNIALGVSALSRNTDGYQNIAIGDQSLLFNSSGFRNTAIGLHALENKSTGEYNIAIGWRAGVSSGNPSNSIIIGNEGASGDTATIKIGTEGTHTRAFIAGITGQTTGVDDAVGVMIDSNGQLGTVSSSRRYKEDIQTMPDLSTTLMRLRPVTFRYRRPYSHGTKPMQYGLIAEEVAEVLPHLAVFNDKGQPETVKYHELPSLLLAAFQRQQQTIQAQAERIAALERRLAAIEARSSRSDRRHAAAQ